MQDEVGRRIICLDVSLLAGRMLKENVMICVVSWLARCKRLKGRRRVELNLLGYKLWCLALCLSLRYQGRFHWWGGYLYPSVPRSPGVSPQKGRAAHGPLHPAVNKSLEIVLGFVWFCIRSLVLVKVCCSVFLSQGLEQCIGFWPFRTRPL